MQEKKKQYRVPGNIAFIYRELWGYDKKPIFYSMAEVFVAVAASYGAVYMPSYVVKMLEQDMKITNILMNILFAFVVYGVIHGVRVYLERRNSSQYVMFRCVYLWNKLDRKTLTLDYFQVTDEKIKKLCEKSKEACCWGNAWGVEAILNNHVEEAKAVLGLLLYMIVIAEVNPWMILLLTGVSLLQIAGFRFADQYEERGKGEKADLNITRKYLDGQAFSVATGKDIRLYQLQSWLGNAYEKANKKYQKLVAKERGHYFANDLFGLTLQALRDMICYTYLIGQLKQGMAASDFVLYVGMVAGFSSYFSEITRVIAENLRAHKAVSFYREYLDLKTEMHHGTGEKIENVSEALEVEFSHVSFSYKGEEEEKQVLDDVSFRIKSGEKLALVGINGAGKTTIVKLICGLYKPDAGHIYINGIDITQMDLEDYYRYLAVVFQEAFVYLFTLADNVCCDTEEKQDIERCVQAMKDAGIWEKVSHLPKKEQTYLDKYIEEDGIQLSGGQRQRLLLARALYKDCKLLLLDEPTAALDAIAESELYEKYNALLKGKTLLFISHRLASTRFCDNILFLENGKLVEQGTHEQLMWLEGKYAHMFEVQSRYYKEGVVTE